MKRQQPDIIEHTIAFWRKRTGQEVCHEEARQMASNVAGFFAVLAEWNHKSRKEIPKNQETRMESEDKAGQSPRDDWGSTNL